MFHLKIKYQWANISIWYEVTITTKDVNSDLAHDEVYSIQHYVIKFFCDLRQAGGFLWVVSVISTN